MGVVVHRATRVRRRECPTINASNDPIPNDQRFQRSTINVADDGLVNGAHFLPSGVEFKDGSFRLLGASETALGRLQGAS